MGARTVPATFVDLDAFLKLLFGELGNLTTLTKIMFVALTLRTVCFALNLPSIYSTLVGKGCCGLTSTMQNCHSLCSMTIIPHAWPFFTGPCSSLTVKLLKLMPAEVSRLFNRELA